MKKLFVCFVVFILNNMPSTAMAQYVGPLQDAEVKTATMASRAADGMPVTLEGFLIDKIRDEHYTFQDASGSIEVEIEREHFPTVPVAASTKLRLRGKVDKDFAHDATVEVDQVSIIVQ